MLENSVKAFPFIPFQLNYDLIEENSAKIISEIAIHNDFIDEKNFD